VIVFLDVAPLARLKSPKNHFNIKPKLLSGFNLIWGVQISAKKYSDFPKLQINLYPWTSRLSEGRFAIVTNVRRDAVDADSAFDEWREGGRRSRVVLTPRRWRQVCGLVRKRR
jgi:hypothetical protein